MSAWGFGGFANGFLQGFNTMGQEFARRGLLRRERETSARDERRLALDEEIQRGNAARAEQEAALRREEMGLTNAALKAKIPYVEPLAKAEVGRAEEQVTGLSLDNQAAKAKAPFVGEAARLAVAGAQQDVLKKTVDAEFAGPKAQSDLAGDAAKTRYYDANTKEQVLKNEEAEQKQQTQRRLADSFRHFVNGDANDKHMQDVELVLPLAGTRVSEINKILDQAREKVRQTGGEYRPDTDPQVMTALNDVFGGFIGRTRGMPVNLPGAPDQQYTVGNTRLIGFERNPQNPKQMGPVFEVEAVATPQLQDEIKQMIASGRDGAGELLTPEQVQGLETLTRRTYRAPLTQGRVPFNQGGERVWFNPEDFEEMRKDLSKVETWQKKHPEFAAQLAEYRAQLARDGVLSPPKPIDQEKAFKQKLDAREDTRKTLEHNEKRRGATLKRIDAMLAKRFGQGSLDEIIQLGGPNAEKAYTLQLAATRILDEHPDWNEAKVMEAADKESGDKPSTPSPGKGGQDGAPTSDKLDRFLYKKGT